MTPWIPTERGWRLDAEGRSIDISAGAAADASAPPVALLAVASGDLRVLRAIVDLQRRVVLSCIGGAELANRLVSEMPDAVRDELLAARRPGIDLERARLSRAQIESGKTVGVAPLYSGRGDSIMQRGTSFLGVLEHEGRVWVTERSICANPSCDCREAFVHVEGVDSSGVSALLDLDTGALEPRGAWGVSDELGEALLAALRAQPDLRERATRDYADLEEVARRSLRKATRKPSRNAPCPCGSGRRYKSCCGQSR